jgi:precorrin-2 dehydrogenase / sirohydrochlorin ferrochelatase
VSRSLESGTLSVEVVMRGRRALVVGGCHECALKVERLLSCGAKVLVVAPETVETSIEDHAAQGDLVLERRAFRDSDIEGVAVTFVSPDLEQLGLRLSAQALREGRLVSTLDRPEASTFVNPAVVEKSGIKLALSSGGQAPALLRRMREELETAFAEPLLAALVSELREARSKLPRGQRREALLALIEGFALRVTFTFPDWLIRKNLETQPK